MQAIRTDAQVESRFWTFELPRWREDQPFRSLLATVASALPLRRPSELHEPACVRLLLGHTGGVTRDVFRVVVRAAATAIHSGAERIDAGLLGGERPCRASEPGNMAGGCQAYPKAAARGTVPFARRPRLPSGAAALRGGEPVRVACRPSPTSIASAPGGIFYGRLACSPHTKPRVLSITPDAAAAAQVLADHCPGSTRSLSAGA